MRERLARWLAVATGMLLLMLAAALAGWQNRVPTERTRAARDASSDAREPAAAAASLSALAARGQAIYRAQGCARCHAVADIGNPRSPLDGVGLRRDASQLRQWITADPAVAEALSARTRALKSGYKTLSPGDLDALVAYLQSLPPTH
ncbi:MAG: hypothetical protein CVV14_02225 [Gammaproteobacteria bacterium HGW-Gammaproteobacteria-4]|jgi:mono/diheme cytochrome c family protein|nr:MAG: hypothetical protein CVV14_02225 [Gammaproteobacteria bacterium HGW-Gammaproteobacteria-4]